MATVLDEEMQRGLEQVGDPKREDNWRKVEGGGRGRRGRYFPTHLPRLSSPSPNTLPAKHPRWQYKHNQILWNVQLPNNACTDIHFYCTWVKRDKVE